MADILQMLANDSLCDLTGNRLWLDDIQKVPGLSASINSYITYDNLQIPALIQYEFFEDEVERKPSVKSHRWTPAGIEAAYDVGALQIYEKKYITKEDVFASILVLENSDSVPHKYRIKASTLLTHVKSHFRALYNPNFIEYHNAGTKTVKMQLMIDLIARNVLRQNVRASIVFYSDDLLVDESNDTFCVEFILDAHSQKQLRLIGGMDHGCNVEQLGERLTEVSAVHDWGYNDECCRSWFLENVPQLTSSDPALEKLYYYRWYIVYKNLIQPGVDCFKYLCMYEGKDEFSLVCSASAAMHIREMRWLRDQEYVMSELKTLKESQIKEGTTAGRLRDLYVSDLPTAIWETYCLLPSDLRAKVLANRESIRQYVEWEQSKDYIPVGSELPIVVGSWRTAAEYQPSFFEFTTPQWDHQQSNPFGNERNTQLHRVDDSVYLCTNLSAVASFYRVSGDLVKADKIRDRAERIRTSIQTHMWDRDSAFYYDLNPNDLRKALQSKNYAGFLGARVNLSQAENEALMDHLNHEFAAPYPIPTVAKDCPAFAPDNTWRIGPNATSEEPFTYNCCWNGPAWNFANSLVIDTLGSVVQKSKTRRHEELFADLFMKWCSEQCRDETAIPNACEHYNCFTGEELRDIRDYAHSTFVDIVMRRVVGLIENEYGRLLCSPIDIGIAQLTISDIPYCGHSVTFIWDVEQQYKFQLVCDGKIVHQSDHLTPVDVSILK